MAHRRGLTVVAPRDGGLLVLMRHSRCSAEVWPSFIDRGRAGGRPSAHVDDQHHEPVLGVLIQPANDRPRSPHPSGPRSHPLNSRGAADSTRPGQAELQHVASIVGQEDGVKVKRVTPSPASVNVVEAEVPLAGKVATVLPVCWPSTSDWVTV